MANPNQKLMSPKLFLCLNQETQHNFIPEAAVFIHAEFASDFQMDV